MLVVANLVPPNRTGIRILVSGIRIVAFPKFGTSIIVRIPPSISNSGRMS